jgi:hypothetical protein
VAGIQIRDKLPRGLQIPPGTSPAASLGSYDPKSGVWSLGTLPPGTMESLILVAEQEGSFTGCVTNEASAELTDTILVDPVTDNNTARVDVGVGGCTDVAILDIAAEIVTSRPRRVKWTVAFGMLGPGSSVRTPFSMEFKLPSGATFDAFTLTGEAVPALSCAAKGRRVRCSSATDATLVCGPLHGFAVCQATLTATAPGRLSGPFAITIAGSTADPDSSNNRARFSGL